GAAYSADPEVGAAYSADPEPRGGAIMSDVVLVEVEDRIATVTLNRPDKLNAVSPAVFDGLHEAGQQVAEDSNVRAVILRGEGRAFCAGLDLQSLQGFGQGNIQVSEDRPQDGRTAQSGFSIWH